MKNLNLKNNRWKTSRLAFAFVCFLLLSVALNPVYGQVQKLSLKLTNVKVEKVLTVLEEKADIHFFYNNKLVNVDRIVSIDVNDESIDDILSQLFASTDVTFEKAGKQIILSKNELNRSTDKSQPVQTKKTVSGIVRDSQGEPMIFNFGLIARISFNMGYKSRLSYSWISKFSIPGMSQQVYSSMEKSEQPIDILM